MENETIEYKKSLTQLKEGLISIVAILNKHKKGTIYFSAKNVNEKTLRDISQTISNHIEPKIYPEIKQEKNYILINFSGNEIPYFAYGRAYIRVSDEDKKLSSKELENFILNKNKHKLRWDNEINKNFSLQDISDNKLKKYIKSINLKYTSKKDALEKLDLIRENHLTYASILLFGKKEFKYLNVRCATFLRNDNLTSPIDMTDFNGDLFEMIDFSEKYILSHINTGMKLDGLKRIDVPEINKDAIREAIVNAFCHRDYSIPQEISIAIYKNKVEIRNPGGIIDGISIKEIIKRRISKRRNELIANLLHRIKFIEKWGTGIKKIKELEPKTKFEEFNDFFNVIFQRKISIDSLNYPLNEGLNEGLKSLLTYFKNNPGKKAKDAEIDLNRSIKTIERQIKILIEKNLIERRGSRKTGGYFAK